MTGLLVGPFLSMVDTNVLTVAIPSIAKAMNSTPENVQWTLSGYLLALGTALPASAYLARRYGMQRTYRWSMLGFTLTSLLCVFAQTLPLLVAARVAQGVTAAPLVPMAMGILFGGKGVDTDLGGRYGRALAAVLLFLAPALGPTIGGFLLGIWPWWTLFLINVPIGILGLAGMRQAAKALPPDTVDPRTRLDVVGLVMLAIGLALTLLALGRSGETGWLAMDVWPLWVGGLLAIAAYAIWARRVPSPAVRLDLLTIPQNLVSTILITIVSVVLFGVLFLVPVVLRGAQDVSPIGVGLALLPQGIAMGLSSDLGERAGRAGHLKITVIAGMLIMTVSTALLLIYSATTPLWLVAVILTGRGVAVGMVIGPLISAMLRGLPTEQAPDATTLFNVVQRLAAGVGIAGISSLFTARIVHHHTADGTASGAVIAGFHDIIAVLSVLSVAGLLLALLVRAARPESSTAA
ncbi:DHA2 family efflux MFS transporter permease subunit [Nocardia sp. NPDC050789]